MPAWVQPRPRALRYPRAISLPAHRAYGFTMNPPRRPSSERHIAPTGPHRVSSWMPLTTRNRTRPSVWRSPDVGASATANAEGDENLMGATPTVMPHLRGRADGPERYPPAPPGTSDHGPRASVRPAYGPVVR